MQARFQEGVLDMDVILVMLAGVLVGAKVFPERHKAKNEVAQVACTALLIFSMGVMLGKRDNFLGELAELGLASFLCFLIPAVFSTILVYFLSRRFLPDNRKKEEKK